MAQKIGAALLAHAETIWRTADTLRAAGVKESEFPSYMMPFFALMLLESRLRRFKAEKVAEFEKAMKVKFDPANKDHRDWLEAAAKAVNKGYHPELLLLDKGLRETCAVPGGNFRARLMAHLDQYDPETKKLLGLGYAESDPKYLDIQGKATDLFARPNSLLFAFAQKWAAIDLTPFSNSEVTTMEEHIKRKWGDISAETAGEQYTPSDVIDLCNTLVVEMRKRGGHAPDGIAKCYDMTCGGGNFLFGGEDALRQEFPELSVQTFGQELNDALYALAAIEARFREDAIIAHGNTLTHDHFLSERFDVIQANPPYGSDWKDFKATVEADATGRFAKKRLPPVSDGQLLFLQHAAFHLAERGVATIVHNGSTLFSGDAGSGESETRIWLLRELDLVEAIIQLPKSEFFNTDISTYVWVLNKQKPAARKGKVLLINAEEKFTKLKRNLNKKNCEMDPQSRIDVLAAFQAFADGPISRVLDVEDVFFNRVEILVHRHDEEGLAIERECKLPHAATAVRIDGFEITLQNGCVASEAGASAKETAAAFNQRVKGSGTIDVWCSDGSFWCCSPDYRVQRCDAGGSLTNLGFGRIRIKAKVAKAKGSERVVVDVELAPHLEKEVEVVPYFADSKMNQTWIDGHMSRWIREPFEVVGSRVGCEINFNQVFPKVVRVETSKDVLSRIASINKEVAALEREFAAAIAEGVQAHG